jgi:hypothetical protein
MPRDGSMIRSDVRGPTLAIAASLRPTRALARRYFV